MHRQGGGRGSDGSTSPHETHFAAGLEMIERLPLSDVEKAQAVRRLLRSS